MKKSPSDPGRLRLWAWRHGGEWLNGVRYWLYGHLLHWRERHRWMVERGSIQIVQMCMAILSLGLGLIFVCTGNLHSGSPVMDLFDRVAGPPLALFLQDVHLQDVHLPLRVSPHQGLGLLLTVSSLLLGVAVYEWPMEDDLVQSSRSEVGREITDHRLRRLLRMHLVGHFAGLIYWFLYFAIMLAPVETHLLALWFSACFCRLHYWMYQRVNREYVKEVARIARIRRGEVANAAHLMRRARLDASTSYTK